MDVVLECTIVMPAGRVLFFDELDHFLWGNLLSVYPIDDQITFTFSDCIIGMFISDSIVVSMDVEEYYIHIIDSIFYPCYDPLENRVFRSGILDKMSDDCFRVSCDC